MDYKKMELCTLADGAAVEKFDAALREALDNIDDPNTDAEEVRTITIKVKISPNQERDQAVVEVQAITKLAPRKASRGVTFMKSDGRKLVAFEHNFRQPGFGFDEPKNVTNLDRKSQAAGEKDA